MSRAFTKEDAQQEDVMVVARPPLPDGESNLVTLAGLRSLQEEERVLAARLESAAASGDERAVAALETASDELALRLGSAVVIDAATNDKLQVRFGDLVTLKPVTEAASGGFTLRIVGVDEADPEEDKISFLAPLAQGLLGREVGQRVSQGSSGSSRELEIVAIE